MRVKLPSSGLEFKVRFHHTHYDTPTLIILGERERRVTDKITCHIEAKETAIVSLHEHSWCSAHDEFNLHEGRRVALRRLLGKYGFNATDRKVFWDAFLKTVPKPKPSYAYLKELNRMLRNQLDVAVRLHQADRKMLEGLLEENENSCCASCGDVNRRRRDEVKK